MPSITDVLYQHEQILKHTDGAAGIRDEKGLESAIARPFQTFGDEDLYPSALEKAVALFESLIVNHPIVDGNKRTGFMIGLSLLERNGLTIKADMPRTYDFVMGIAAGD